MKCIKNKRMNVLKLLLVTVVALGLMSCASYFDQATRGGTSSSLVEFLYPEGQIPPKNQNDIPHLNLPLTVGLAFVPASKGQNFKLPEAKKAQLLEQVKERFTGLDYIKKIEVIPEAYMKTAKGFNGIDQVSRLYGLDAIALVSYDQVAVVSETKSSILYWTIVGAYFVKGNQNQATTFVDTAVFDVKTKKMLFRAPGVSDLKKASTFIEVNQTNRETREQGFELAMANMTTNLTIELEAFEDNVKSNKEVRISNKEGYSGGIQWPLLLMLIGVAFFRIFLKK